MQLGMYAVYDNKVEYWQSPMFVRHGQDAMRFFVSACKYEDTMMREFPSQFDLYFLGYFNDQDGVFEPHLPPQKVMSGRDIEEVERERKKNGSS